MSTSAAVTLRDLLSPPPSADGIDRKALAGLLVELAHNVKPEQAPAVEGVPRVDLRLDELRRLVLGREIELLARLGAVIEDPEQLAAAVGRVLPTSVAHATADERLGQVLTPAFEKATQSSIRSNPRTLINILYPLIVPAIRKAIGETIDDTFQSLNESLKASLTWRGLKWRFEAWRTGTTFAETVLKHTLVYQVEHAFLIHHHTGLLIAHAAAENAASQDPQLVSSMLVAIQDFVRDSFTGAEQQGLDTLRLGELRLWSERGPFATLVAVIRGNPPEELHATLSRVLSQIHAERRQVLESFDGDSSGLGDIEAHLAECAALRQQSTKSARRGFPWLVAAVGVMLLMLAGAGGTWWWQETEARQAEQRAWAAARQAEQRLWADAVARLKTVPGIVVTESDMRDGKFSVAGLRDPLAADPGQVLERPASIPRASSAGGSPISRSIRNSRCSACRSRSIRRRRSGFRWRTAGSWRGGRRPPPGSSAPKASAGCCRQAGPSSISRRCSIPTMARSPSCATRSSRTRSISTATSRCRRRGRTRSSISSRRS